MRLAPKRRAQWLRTREFHDGVPEQVPTRSGIVEVVRMGEGDPILLVPGLAGGWKLLAPLARRLANRHEVILASHWGDRGLMVGPGRTTLAAYADDLAELIEGLRLERPTVFGVSFGGAVALELAVEHPSTLGMLVVQGAESRFRGGLGARIARQVLERYPLPRDNGFVNQFFNILHGCRPDPGALPEFVVRRCWETDQGVMAGRLRALESFDVTDQLWRVEVPTLVLAGTRDAVVTPARHRALADAIPGARFELLEGAGHIGFLTHREEVARHVGRLIRARAGSRS
jgi:pimeloyl-ACP methyl ester carboxylesterase